MSDQYGGATAPAPRKVTVPDLVAMKRDQKRITMMTAYDAAFARLVDQAGIDVILVGDSLGMVVLGYPTTVPVTMDDMVRHAAAVSRGASRPLLVGDMPFGSYQAGPADALHKTARSARKLIDDALALEDAGAFSIVLESVPAPVAALATEHLRIPTIGIGAGIDCDGQVLVLHDVLGLFGDFKPKFAKRYADIGAAVTTALRDFDREVRDGSFPTDEHSFTMKESELLLLQRSLAQQKAS